MGISLPVGSHLDDSQARRTAKQAEDYFATAGRQAGDAFSLQVNQGLGRVDTGKARLKAAELQRAYDKAADAAGKLRVEEEKLAAVNAASNSTNSQKIAAAERVEKARRAESRAVRDLTNDLRDLDKFGRSAPFMDSLSSSVDHLGTAARSFAVAGLPAAVLAVGGAAVTAAGALAVLPAAIGGVVAGIGTLVVGMHGFGSAIKDMGDTKKFAEDLQKLSPNAQQAALSIQQLVNGPLGALKKATQESLFAGMGKEFHDVANALLPSVQTATTGIASAFNGMARGAMDQLMKPETAAALNSTLTNVTTAFQNLAPAAAPFTKAMTDIVQVGSTFLPGMSTWITNAATALSQFITHARDTGQLATWIREGSDVLKDIARLVVDIGRAVAGLMPVAREIFPYVTGALHEVSSVLHDHPGLIWGVVGAFGAWKTIEGVSALITSLGTIKTALLGLPAVAGTAATGISAALSKIALPAWLAWMIGKEHDKDPAQQKANDAVHNNDLRGFMADFQGGGGTFLPPMGPDTRTPKQIQDQNLQRRMGLPGGQPMPAPAPGWDSLLPQNAGLAPWTPIAVPADPGDGKKHKPPTVPLGNNDPMSLLQGFPATAELYGAAGTVLDNQQKVAQAQSDLNTLEKANVRDEDAIIAKKNELGRANRELHESELRLNDAKQNAVNKSLKGLKDAHGAFSEIGAGLDADLGISKGLSGIADNLVRFFGHLALAPLEGKLAAEVDADPRKGGYGLMGILGAQGLFGDQFTGMTQQRGSGMYPVGSSAMSGRGLNLSTIPVAAQQYANDCIDASARIILSHAGINMSEDQLKNVITPGGTIDSLAAGLNQLNPQGRYVPMQGSGGSQEAMFNAIKASIDNGTGSILNVAPGSSLAGHTFAPGHFIAATGYNPDGTINVSDTAGGRQYSVSQADAFQATRGRGVVAGTGVGPPPSGMATSAQDAAGALTGLAGAANAATQAIAGGGGSGGGGWSADWNAIAQKESGGNWGINTGNGFSGGLQFTPSSWAAAGGTQYAPSASQASPYQQALTAEQLLKMQGPGAWPNTFTPGSSGPVADAAGGMYPGMGMPQGLPFAPLGPITPGGPGIGLGSAAGLGPAQPGLGAAATLGGAAFNPQNPTQIGGGPGLSGQGSGIGMSQGGTMDLAMQAGSAALDALAPGAGQAAQTGIKLANRAIQFGGQAAGIGVQGLMDTFLPFGGSELASNNWLTRIVGGFAGAHPTIPNIAGKQAPQQPQQQPGAGDQQGQGGNTTNITVNNQRATEDGTGKDIAWHQSQAAQAPGM